MTSQSERISQILDNSRVLLSRNKTRDASEITNMRKAKASTVAVPQIVKAITDPHTSQIVPNYQYGDDCAAVTYFKGGPNDSSMLTNNKQNGPVCCDDTTTRFIILPTPKCPNPTLF